MSIQFDRDDGARLERQSPVPLYHQLKGILRSWITGGMYESGQKFPTESELEQRFGISRMTVRRALTELTSEGFLVRQRGLGSFVAKTRVQDRLQRLTSFTEDMREQGLESSSEILEFQVLHDNDVANRLGISVDEELVQLSRIRRLDGEPLALQTSFLRHSFCPGIADAELVNDSLYRTLEERYNLLLGDAIQTAEAKPADEYESSNLMIRIGYPVLVLERLAYLQNGEPIEYVRSAYRGDRYRFRVELSRGS